MSTVKVFYLKRSCQLSAPSQTPKALGASGPPLPLEPSVGGRRSRATLPEDGHPPARRLRPSRTSGCGFGVPAPCHSALMVGPHGCRSENQATHAVPLCP